MTTGSPVYFDSSTSKFRYGADVEIPQVDVAADSGTLAENTAWSDIPSKSAAAALNTQAKALQERTNWIRANQPVVVANIAALRLLDKTKIGYAVTKGYYTAGDGGAGEYWYDGPDTTSTDNGGTVITASDGGRWKLIHKEININQFGALPSQTSAVNTPAISKALLACPSGGVICALVAGEYPVDSSPSGSFIIDKRILCDWNGIKFVHNPSTTGSLFVFKRTASTPSSDCNFNGQLEGIQFRNVWITAQTWQGMSGYTTPMVDNRTSVADVLVFDSGIDGFTLDSVVIEGFKGSGIYFSGNGSIRESTWRNFTIRYCGNSSTGKADIHIVNVSSSGDAHNELFFLRFRLVYSCWRAIHITRGATSGGNGVRIVNFSHFHIENEVATGGYWNAPPAVEKVWIEEAGTYVSFEDGHFFNQYDTDVTKWGYPSLRVGNTASGYAVDRINLTNCTFQGDSFGGIGVLLENCRVCTLSTVRVAMSNYSQARSVVVATITPTALYGVSSAPAYYTLVYADPSCDVGRLPYYNDGDLSRFTGKACLAEYPDSYQQVSFSPGGFASGLRTYSVAVGSPTYKQVTLQDFNNPLSGADNLGFSVWVISAVANTGSALCNASALVVCLDQNIVASVQSLGAASLNSNLSVSFRAADGLTPGTLSSNKGLRFDLVVTNATGGAVTFTVSATRLGCY